MALISRANRRKPSAKPLFLIALSIIACTSVISAVLVPGEVEHGLNTLGVASNGVSNVRTPKHDATSDSISTPAARVTTSLRYHSAKLIPWLRLSFSSKTPEEAFIYFKLDKKADKLLESPTFSVWVNFVRRKYPKSAGYDIIETLVSYYKDDGLARLLVGGLKSREWKRPMLIFHDLREYWRHKKEFSIDDVFDALKLNKKMDEQIIHDDLLNVWIDYVFTHRVDSPTDVVHAKIASFPHFKDTELDERPQAINKLYNSVIARYQINFLPLVHLRES